ncbi:MAG: hypothetical protein JXA71_02925 [Chitinispirillaceae bacterium]|nr:hypothetical protein [Chitinispirillaceae bacterium]
MRLCCRAASESSLKVIPLVLTVLVAAGFFFCSPPERFTTLRLYTGKGFTGRDLNNQTVVLMPLLTARGAEMNDQFQPAVIIAEINRVRTDVQCGKPDRFLNRYRTKYGDEALDSLLKEFYRGEIVSLQTNERLWPEVGSGYLMVLKLNYGMKATSLDKHTLRQMKLEGELWDCDSSEVVWRAVVDARSRLSNQTDKDVLLKAAVKLFEALPSTLKGYGKGSW